MKKLSNKISQQFYLMLAVIVIVIAAGLIILGLSHASSPFGEVVSTSGNISGAASIQSSSGATNGRYVQFNGQTTGGSSLCGFKTGSPTISKVMIVWEENESDSSIIGNSSLPYMNSLVSQCGFASNYWAYTHPSEPNYMAMTSGVSYASGCWPSDNDPGGGCLTSNASLFSQLGSNWKSYVESMNSSCDKTTSSPYAAKHNPAVYYTNLSNCSSQDVSLGSFTSGNLFNDVQSGSLPELSTITPNLDNDWHDGSASQADNWLKGFMGLVTAGSDYQNGKLAVLVVFDEGNGSGNVSSNTYADWVSPFVTPGTSSKTCFDNNSVTQTVEKLFNLSVLNSSPLASNCSTETNMVSAFNL
jgi:acid phosphatase